MVMKNKKDYSNICTMDDEDMNNPCWECQYFLFPIGCMKWEEEHNWEEEEENEMY